MILQNIVQSLDIIDWIIMGIALLCLIPAYLFFVYFRRTNLADFGIYTGMWLFGLTLQFGKVAQKIAPTTIIIQQISDSCNIIFWFLVFLYAIRMKWEYPPRSLWYFGIIWFSFMQLTILMYEVVQLPNSGVVLFIEMRKFLDFIPYDIGIGLITQNGVIIMARGFQFLAVVYRLFALLLFIFVHLTVEPAIQDSRINLAKKLWVVAALLACFRPILIIGHSLKIWTVTSSIVNLATLAGMLMIAYVAIRYPEALLLTHVQLIRAYNFYKKIKASKSTIPTAGYRFSSIVEYLQKVPEEILQQAE
ncbi:MAG: hypothetical protein ACXADY_25705 [Candidatus Hodarchaeales archaeon]|jgi:hypothetical protein